MSKFDELLDKLSKLKIIQKSYSWQEDLPEGLWEEYFVTSDGPIAYGIDNEFLHEFEISTEVYKFGDRYLGVRSIVYTFDDISDPADLYHTIEFFEMEPIQVTSYAKKKK